MVRFDGSRYGSARRAKARKARSSERLFVRFGTPRCGKAGQVVVMSGAVRYGKPARNSGLESRRGLERSGRMGHCTVGFGMARQGAAGLGKGFLPIPLFWR